MVAAIAISNGSDNAAVYTALYTGRSVTDATIITVTFIIMIAVWCVGAGYLISHPFLGAHIKRYAEAIFPWLLVAIGISVLCQSALFH